MSMNARLPSLPRRACPSSCNVFVRGSDLARLLKSALFYMFLTLYLCECEVGAGAISPRNGAAAAQLVPRQGAPSSSEQPSPPSDL